MTGIAYMALPVARLIPLEVLEWLHTATRQWPVITVTWIVAVVDVAIKAVWPVKPGTCSNEQSV
jgi:hypothetical protein